MLSYGMNPNYDLQAKKPVTIVKIGKDILLPKYQAMKALKGWEVMLYVLYNLVLGYGA
jgi:hypothetical protein